MVQADDDAALREIRNFERATARIGCSGQPKATQFEAIAEAGFQAVINLALADSDDAIAEEGSIVAGLGMSYHHIPVRFDAPTADDLRTFVGVMRALGDRPVWVHCVVNARVSAFLFHYLTHVEGLSAEQATTRLLRRWKPEMDEVWQQFMALDAAMALRG